MGLRQTKNMKKFFVPVLLFFFLFLLNFLLPNFVKAATYYVSITGSDTNPGTQAQPWKTIAKVNVSSFSPGDSILFKRGETWSETLIPPSSGSAGSPITFGAYGTGDLPTIDGTGRNYCVEGKKDYITITDLHFKTPNQYGIAHTRWTSSGTELSTPGWVIKNSEFTKCGVLLFGPDTIVQDNVFVGPSPITGTDGAIIIRGQVAANCEVLRNTISGYASRGIWFLNAASSPTVNDNIIHDIGFTPGTDQEGYCINFDGYGLPITGIVTALRNTVYNCASNGIEMENCAGGSLISKNLIHDCARSGIIYMNYSASARYPEQRGLDTGGVVSYNIIYRSRYGIELNGVSGVDIWNNVLYEGIGSYPKALSIAGAASFSHNIDFRNNVALTGWSYVISVKSTWTDYLSQLDYCALQSNVIEEVGLHWYTLANLQAAGKALHCFATAPGLVNAAGHDFHLLSSSPCINTGVNVGLTQDYGGNTVPQGAAPDIGAYEYVGAAPPDVTPPAAPTGVTVN
jgi:hypothetical protein